MDNFCRYPKQPSEDVKFCPRRKCSSILGHRTLLTKLSSVDLLCKQPDCVKPRSGTLPLCQEHIQGYRSRTVVSLFEALFEEETLEEVGFRRSDTVAPQTIVPDLPENPLTASPMSLAAVLNPTTSPEMILSGEEELRKLRVPPPARGASSSARLWKYSGQPNSIRALGLS
jgi:hypothetical protein